MRKIISMLLIVLILASTAVIPVAGEGTVVFSTAARYYATIGNSARILAEYDNSVLFGSVGAFVTYEVELDSAGFYTLSLSTTSHDLTNRQITNIYIDGELVTKHEATDLKAFPTYTSYDVATYSLLAGRHTIKLEEARGTYGIKEVTLALDGELPYEPVTKAATDYNSISDTSDGASVVDSHVRMAKAGASVSYTVTLPRAGFYLPVIQSVSYSVDQTQSAKLYVDGAQKTHYSFDPRGWPYYDKEAFPRIFLSAGTYEFKVENVAGTYDIKDLSFIWAGDGLSALQYVQAESFTEKSASGTADFGNGGYVAYTEKNDFLSYNVCVPISGTYDVSLVLSSLEDFELAISSAYSYFTCESSGTGSLTSYEMLNVGSLDLQAGTNTILINNINDQTGAVNLDSFILEPVKAIDDPEMLVQAEDCLKSEGDVIPSGAGLRFKTGSWAVYELLIPQSGYYSLNLNQQAYSTSLVTVFTENGGYAKRTLRASESLAETSSLIKLERGCTSLTIEAAAGDIVVDSFTLAGPLSVTDEDSSSLCNSVNAAFRIQDVHEILKANLDVLLLDTEVETANIFYTEPIYEGMLHKNFQDITDITNEFSQLVYNQRTSPSVALYNEAQQPIEALENGNLRLVVDTSGIFGTATLIAALYQDGKMVLVKSGAVSGKTTELLFPNLDVSIGQWSLRVFCWRDLIDLTPLKLFTNEQVIYVSPQGNDSGDGSKNNPVRTIPKAQELARNLAQKVTGDVVVSLAAGEYFLNEPLRFSEADSGKGSSVIYRGAEDGKTVISGGTKVTGWEKTGTKGIYKASANGVSDTRTLYVNGFPAQRARSTKLYTPIGDYDLPGNNYEADGFLVRRWNFPTVSHPEDMELVWDILWTRQRLPVKELIDSDIINVAVVMDQPYYNWSCTVSYKATAPDASHAFYLENAKELLDEPGEFYFDKREQTVYYYPFAEEDLTTAETYLGTTEFMMYIEGSDTDHKVKNLTFDRLHFRYGAWLDVNRTGKHTVQAEKLLNASNEGDQVHYGRILPAQIQVNYADNLTISNCEFSSLGSGAVSLINGVTNSRLNGNLFHDIGGPAVTVGYWDHGAVMPSNMARSSNIDITNNVIRRAGVEFADTCGISVYYCDNVNILHNDLKELPYTGINIGWGWGWTIDEVEGANNIKVKYNRIDDVCNPTWDGGHIYTLGNLPGTEIVGNYLTKQSVYVGGIYCDTGSAFLKLTDNVVADSWSWLFASKSPRQIYAKDNFSDSDESTSNKNDWKPEHVKVENTTIVKDGNWPDAARAIMENAGVTSPYRYLLEGLDLPSWRPNFVTVRPIG